MELALKSLINLLLLMILFFECGNLIQKSDLNQFYPQEPCPIVLASKLDGYLDVLNCYGILGLVNTVTRGKSTKLWCPIDLVVDIIDMLFQPAENLYLVAIFKLRVFNCLVLEICRNHRDFV